MRLPFRTAPYSTRPALEKAAAASAPRGPRYPQMGRYLRSPPAPFEARSGPQATCCPETLVRWTQLTTCSLLSSRRRHGQAKVHPVAVVVVLYPRALRTCSARGPCRTRAAARNARPDRRMHWTDVGGLANVRSHAAAVRPRLEIGRKEASAVRRGDRDERLRLKHARAVEERCRTGEVEVALPLREDRQVHASRVGPEFAPSVESPSPRLGRAGRSAAAGGRRRRATWRDRIPVRHGHFPAARSDRDAERKGSDFDSRGTRAALRCS